MIIRTKDELKLALDFINSNELLSYDIETTSLNPRTGSIIGFGCASQNLESFYIIMKAWENGQLVERLSYEDVRPIVELLKTKKLIMQNASFDIRFTICQLGIDLRDALYADTILMAHSCDENLPTYSLKPLAAMIFGADSTKQQEEMLESIKRNGGGPKEYYKADSELLAKYGLQDNILTMRLFKYWAPKLKEQGLERFFYSEEVMPLYREVTIDMELRGIPVDLPLIQKTHEEITAKIAEYETKIQEAIKPLLTYFHDWYINKNYPFRLSGPFKQKLAQKFAHPVWPRTDTGAYSFNKVDLARAKKKLGLPDDTLLERYTVTLTERVPDTLIREVQLELLADEGTKYPFNLSSKDHLKRLFFGYGATKSVLNETALSFTDKGNPQVDEEFLELMAKKYEWAKWLRIYNKLNKIKSTYVERFLEEHEDGIFYPSFYQSNTVSGRYGSDFQQLPRPLEEGQDHVDVIEFNNRIRRFFVPPAGYTIVDDDYESLEPHIFAHVAGDEGLKDIFRNGHDFYSTIAIKTEKLRDVSADKKASNYLGKVDKPRRQKAKAYCLGVPYGMSAYKLQYEIGVSQSEAEKLIADYLNAFPALKAWMEASKQFAIKHGYIKTETGRVRRFPRLKELYTKYGEMTWDSLALWQQYHEVPEVYALAKYETGILKNYINNARNIQIQGLAASIVNRACIAIARELRAKNLDARICAQVHDEIVLFAHENCAAEVCEIVQRCMETTYPISITLKAKPSTGANLAEAKAA